MADLIYMAKTVWQSLLDSIREKAGMTDTLTASEAKDAVDSIQTGGYDEDYLAQRLNNRLVSYVSDDVESVPQYAFASASELEEIALDNVTTIGAHAFEGCSKLVSAVMPNLSGVIPNYAFAACHSLRDLRIGKVVSVEQYAFSGCTSLEQYPFDLITGQISNSAFDGCTALKAQFDLVQANTFSQYAFRNCISLGPKLKIKRGGTSSSSGGRIQMQTFQGCTGLEKVWISKDIYTLTATSQTRAPFSGCTALTDIYTDASNKPSDWGRYFAYTNTEVAATVHYGISADDFDAL